MEDFNTKLFTALAQGESIHELFRQALDEETYIAVFAPYILNRRSPYPRLQIIPLPKKDKED